MPDEWLGELAFTHYIVTLSSLRGETRCDKYWHSLSEWERTAWIEAAKATVEAAIEIARHS
jgi:hypothetical protein